MASNLPAPLPVRDLDALAALAKCPLTTAQLFTVSATFAYPFTSERKTRDRMQVLADRGLVRRFRYATEGPGVLNYYRLSPEGHRLLFGPDEKLPSRQSFGPIGYSRLQHTQALAAFIVHTSVAAHQALMPLRDFCRENSLALSLDESTLYPDAGFTLGEEEGALRFFVELDTGSERARSEKLVESWQRKIRFYDQYQDRSAERFRVLMVTTAGERRRDNLLAAAAEFTAKPQRSLFYAIRLDDYLSQPEPLHAECFLDHRGRKVALVPGYMESRRSQTLARAATVC